MAKSKTQFIDGPSVFWVCLGLSLLCYIPSLIWMWERWFARDSYYSHGILIPIVSIYLIWQKRELLRNVPYVPSVWGLYLIIAGIAIQCLSALFRVYFASGYSLILLLMGLVLHFGGRKVFKEVLFPLCFLVFMVPLPLVTVVNISFKLKILAAEMATFLLNKVRIACYQSGSMITMSNAHLVVDDLCSGLRSLISLMALGSLFAHWLKGSYLKKIILFLSSIPIAVLTNVGRIFFLAFISEIWGTRYVTKLLHDLSGFAVFILAYFLLYAVSKILE